MYAAHFGMNGVAAHAIIAVESGLGNSTTTSQLTLHCDRCWPLCGYMGKCRTIAPIHFTWTIIGSATALPYFL